MTTALGGVPIGVAIPPIFAAKGTESAIPIRAGSPLSILAIMGIITVIIMAVVAVLLINAESAAVTAINPSIMVDVRFPNGLSRILVRFLSKSYLTAASARTKPPRKRIIIGFASVPIN